MRVILEARNIHKIYTNGKKELHVLKGIDLTIDIGRFVVIVGPSGAGKSTLLHILGGLDSPTKGQVFFAGRDIYGLTDTSLSKLRNEKIGFVFQFYHLLSEFTVLENVLMPALINTGLRMRRDALERKALGLLEKVGLIQRITHFPVQLSGGEQQRVAVVRGLINEPEILFCDEPTGNLDSKTGEEIISLLKRINLENKMTVVLVTHNPELAKIADSIYRLQDGVLEN
ncbi:MAG: ABC transporter ATP-binding protein [Candidatus Omnitrophica bacterium]|nr:ABC transporter ATP-binding protein [Candidatus Omnitrophota bacterium]